ncbi:nuclear factor NF-kappa-B p110 subunit-like isoform X1 [Trichogramma pretiosum]|uniref:nuclear factor NF-kappa-B p110 subunit-like isoform X1 n=2 Tax=Trichogramma pretiosum TaxID=7493 RepID=UPI0006C97AEA|nr:nuclear factor NF-kappa-B p110 subunit-like isoform X1 [Trichogramma pretiosum]
MTDAYENFINYKHNMLRLSPAPAEHFFTYSNDFGIMSSAGYSPVSMGSQTMDMEDFPSEIISATDDQSQNVDISICEKTKIKILVQPIDKFRFRYKSEMLGTHGSLLGDKDNNRHKRDVPTVQLFNCPFKKAVIRCTIVTANEDKRFPHAHRLVKKNSSDDTDDPHDIEVSAENDYTATFYNMGIIHTAKKHIKDEIYRKRRMELLETKKRQDPSNVVISTREEMKLQSEAENAKNWMNLNSVALCFQGYIHSSNNALIPFTEKVYSRPINNLKSALTGELKICRIDKSFGCVDGNDEIWILVEKVGKKNIRVKIYELDEDTDNTIWEADGKFSELDVHHQYAIIFRTPPYKDTSTTEPKEVFIRLERPSDGEYSNSVKFTYKPSDKILNRKRPRFEQSGWKSNNLDDPKSLNINAVEMIKHNPTETAAEIQKILHEDYSADLEAMDPFLGEGLDNWLALLANSKNPMLDTDIVTDSADVELKHSERFADNILFEILKILQISQSTKQYKSDSSTKIRNLLQQVTYYGDTPLHFSLRYNQYECTKNFIRLMAVDSTLRPIANIQNSSGETPLHFAVRADQPETVQALLVLDANPNIGDENDYTPLHRAIVGGYNTCLKILLKYSSKLNLDSLSDSGWAPLHMAAKTGSLDAVKALIKSGANVNITDNSYGRSALHIAVDHNHLHIVKFLVENTKIEVNMKNMGGNTALHTAAVKKCEIGEKLVELLKKHGALSNLRNNSENHQTQNETSINFDVTQNTNDIDIQDEHSLMIKSEVESEEEDEEDSCEEPAEPFSKDAQRLMELLNAPQPYLRLEELVLKEETESSDDDLPLQERLNLSLPDKVRRTTSKTSSSSKTEIPATENRKRNDSKILVKAADPVLIQKQLDQLRKNEVKFTKEHVNAIKEILDSTGVWEKLAHHTNHGTFIRLYKKTSSPSTALFTKILLQMPDTSVRQVKKWLIDIEAFEAASALEEV